MDEFLESLGLEDHWEIMIAIAIASMLFYADQNYDKKLNLKFLIEDVKHKIIEAESGLELLALLITVSQDISDMLEK